MTIPRNLACKDGLVYVPKHSRRNLLSKPLGADHLIPGGIVQQIFENK